jgi:hypothetical protein
MGYRAGEGRSLHNLGEVARAQGQLDAAADYYQQALAIYEAMGVAHEAQRVRQRLDSLDAERASGALADAGPPVEDAAPSILPPAPPVVEPSHGQEAEDPPPAPARKKHRWWPFGR